MFAILLHAWGKFELDIMIANTSDVFLKMILDNFVPHIDVRFASFSTAVICYFCYFACTKRASFHYPSVCVTFFNTGNYMHHCSNTNLIHHLCFIRFRVLKYLKWFSWIHKCGLAYRTVWLHLPALFYSHQPRTEDICDLICHLYQK